VGGIGRPLNATGEKQDSDLARRVQVIGSRMVANVAWCHRPFLIPLRTSAVKLTRRSFIVSSMVKIAHAHSNPRRINRVSAARKC
jgi:hypothetical protein